MHHSPKIWIIGKPCQAKSSWFDALLALGMRAHEARDIHQLPAEAFEGAIVIVVQPDEPLNDTIALAAYIYARGCICAVDLRNLNGHNAVPRSPSRVAETNNVDPLLFNLCAGRVVKHWIDLEPIAESIVYRLTAGKPGTLEYVSTSPDKSALVWLDTHLRATLTTHTCLGEGDPVTTIQIQTPRTIRIVTQSGSVTEIQAPSVFSKAANSDSAIHLDLSPATQPAAAEHMHAVAAQRAEQSTPGHAALSPPLDVHESVGQQIRYLRMQAGLTQAELARLTGIHRPNIARLERGKHIPSWSTIERIATALGVAPSRIMPT